MHIKEVFFTCSDHPLTLPEFLLLCHIPVIDCAIIMANPSTPNLPTGPVIADLTDEEHIDFIKTFQPTFDIFYSTSAARVRGAQKIWVIKHVMGVFQQKFGPCSETLLKVCLRKYYSTEPE